MDASIGEDEEVRVVVVALKDGSTKCHFEVAKGLKFKDAEEAFFRCIQALQWEAENSPKCPFSKFEKRQELLQRRVDLIRKTGYGGGGLTKTEKKELAELDRKTKLLPTRSCPKEQAAMDIILRAAERIRKKNPAEEKV